MRGRGVPFVKGDPRAGRPKGRKNKLPADSIRAMCKWLAEERPEVYRDAILRGLRAREAKSFPFVQLAAYYLDGKPVERLLVQADGLSSRPGRRRRRPHLKYGSPIPQHRPPGEGGYRLARADVGFDIRASDWEPFGILEVRPRRHGLPRTRKRAWMLTEEPRQQKYDEGHREGGPR